MFLLKQVSKGDLNADYAVRVNKFLTMYEKRPSPPEPGPDPANPLFKGYKVRNLNIAVLDQPIQRITAKIHTYIHRAR